MSGLTFISSCHIIMDVEELKDIVITTLVRWLHGPQRNSLHFWLPKEGTETHVLEFDCLLFELVPIGVNDFILSMNAIGNYRRHGSSCEYFDRVFDCLALQIGRPDTVFTNMNDCLAIVYPPLDFDHFQNQRLGTHVSCALPVVGAFAEDEEDDAISDDEEDEDASLDDDLEVEDLDDDLEVEDVDLCDMTDVQIDEYIENLGLITREEVDEWTMDYEGGEILRYSYVNFDRACLAEQQVSNVVIRNAKFTNATLRNYVFDNVDFYDCDFKGVMIDNVTFRNSSFIECYLHPNTLESCTMENNTFENYSVE